MMIDDDNYDEHWYEAHMRNIEEMAGNLSQTYGEDPKVIHEFRKIMPPEPGLDVLEEIYTDVPHDFLEDYLRVTLAKIPSHKEQ